LQPNIFWSVINSHRIPNQEELESSVDQYNRAQGIGWLYPVRYMFTLEPKPLLWGACGVFLSIYFIKNGFGSHIFEGMRELSFWAVRKI